MITKSNTRQSPSPRRSSQLKSHSRFKANKLTAMRLKTTVVGASARGVRGDEREEWSARYCISSRVALRGLGVKGRCGNRLRIRRDAVELIVQRTLQSCHPRESATKPGCVPTMSGLWGRHAWSYTHFAAPPCPLSLSRLIITVPPPYLYCLLPRIISFLGSE